MVYTGIVQRVGMARYSWRTHQLEVRAPGFFERTTVGDSISVNGVCLTAVTFTDDVAYFGVMQETRNRTNLAPASTNLDKDAGQDDQVEGSNKEKEIKTDDEEWREVNLELSLLLGQQVGGHFVSGHVDTVAPLGDVVPNPDGSRDLWIDLSRRRIRDVPPSSASSSSTSSSTSSRLPVIHKGSICIDGVSLTVAEWRADEERFKVCLIPHTQAVTTLGKKRAGDEVNIEFDRSLKRLEGADAEWAWTAESAEDLAARVRRQDEEYMRQAIALGEKGRYTAPPNPWVASLIVKDGRILGRGFHAKAGTAHAEVKAIQNALDNGATAADLKGSTFYVTLEPCHHTGRTPPCDRKLLEVGAARVVIAFVDPDDRVNGQGIKLLRESGVEVVVGVCEAEAKQSLLPFVHQRSSGKPYVVIKAAMSLDGRIACEDGTSQWITGENARQDGHRLRAGSQAIIVGSNTALKDRPRLNVRGVAGAETVTPLRVALDSTGKIVDGPLLDVSLGATLIFTSDRVKADVAQLWSDRGVEVVRVGEKAVGQGLDLDAVLTALAQRGILQVLIEGGGKLQSRFLAEDRADKVVLYYGARFLGSGGLPWAQEKGLNADTIATVRSWQLERVQQFGNDVCLEYVKPSHHHH